MQAVVRGSPMPLFDRLAADSEAQLSGADALRESVARELERLLNTRSHLTFEAFAGSDGSVIDYGLPDFSERSWQSGPDRDAIVAAIRHSIARFEPRLTNVTVGFALAQHGTRAVLTIGGEMRSGPHVEHVSFELAADDRAVAAARVTDQG